MKRSVLLVISVFVSGSVHAQPPAPTVTWTLFPDKSDATNAGKVEFDHACSICHGRGPDRPGTTSLQIKYEGKVPALLEERTDLTIDIVKHFVRQGVAMMPRFRKTELTDEQVALIAEYLAKAP